MEQAQTVSLGRRMVKGVDVADGHLAHSAVDLRLKARGFPLEFVRVFAHSRVMKGADRSHPEVAPLGAGWHHNYLSWVEERDGLFHVMGGEGTTRTFRPDASQPSVARPLGGYRGTLAIGKDRHVLKLTTGVTCTFAQAASLGGQRRLYLTEMGDAAGNRLALAYRKDAPGLLHTVRNASDRRVLTLSYARREFPGYGLEARVIRRLTVTFPDGSKPIVVEFGYDDCWGNLVGVGRAGRTYEYGYRVTGAAARHLLTSVTDPHGVASAYTYGRAAEAKPGVARVDQVTRITEADERVTTFAYHPDASGPYSRRTDVTRQGQTTVYEIRPDGLVEKITAPGGRTTRLDWAGHSKRLKREADWSGKRLAMTHWKSGNVYTEKLMLPGKAFHALPQGRVKLPGTIETTYQYSDLDRITSVERREGRAGGKALRWQHEYDAKGLLRRTTGPAGHELTYDHAASGDVTKKEERDGRTTEMVGHNEFGQPTHIVRRIDARRTLDLFQEFDQRGRLIRTVEKAGRRVLRSAETRFDDLDQPVWRREVDGAGPAHVVEYDRTPGGFLHAERHREEEGPVLFERRWEPDALGRVAGECELPRGSQNEVLVRLRRLNDLDLETRVHQYVVVGGKERRDEMIREIAYDAANRVETITRRAKEGGPGVVEARYTYWGASDNVRTHTDHQGNREELHYDSLSRLRARTLPTGDVEYFEYDSRGNLMSETDANGHKTLNEYDDQDRLSTTTDPAGNVVETDYDRAGKVVARRFRHASRPGGRPQRELRNTHDGLGRLCGQTETLRAPGAKDVTYTTTYDHDDAAGVVRIRYPDGGREDEYRDGRGLLVKRVVHCGPTQLVTEYRYDVLGHLVEEKDATGAVTRYAPDGWGRRRSTTDAAGEEEKFAYDREGRLVRHTDRCGVARAWRYDVMGRLTNEWVRHHRTREWVRLREVRYVDARRQAVHVDHSQAGTPKPTETITHDGLGRPVALVHSLYPKKPLRRTYQGLDLATETDRRGNTTTYRYDGRHRRTRIVDGAGRTTNVVFDDAAGTVTETDPSGTVETTFRDPRLREVRKERGGTVLWRREYDGRDRIVRQRRAALAWTVYEHDEAGRLVRVRLPGDKGAERVLYYRLDAAGRRLEEWLRMAPRKGSRPDVRRHFDAMGRVEWEEDALGHRTVYAYDAEGRLVSLTDATGITTRYTRDHFGEIVKLVRDPAGEKLAVTFGREPGGRLASVSWPKKPASIRWSFAYDAMGRLLSRTLCSADGRTKLGVSLGYDPDGNLAAITQPDGAWVRRSFDGAGRVRVQTAGGKGYVPYAKRIAHDYFDRDRILQVSSQKQWKGRVEEEQHLVWYGPDGHMVAERNSLGLELVQTRDDAGRRRELKDSDGAASVYRYDARDRLLSVRGPLGEVVFGYDGADRLVEIRYPNGGRVVYDRKPNGWVWQVRYVDRAGKVEARYAYELTPLGEIASLVETVGGERRSSRFAYDRLRRLVEETHPEGKITYTYDAAGRRATRTADGRTERYRYDGLGRLEKVEEGRRAVATFTYGDNGLLASRSTAKGRWTLYYNPYQKPIVLRFGGAAPERAGERVSHEARLDYDHEGRLLRRLGDPPTVAYLYDDHTRLCELKIGDGELSTWVRYEGGLGFVRFLAPGEEKWLVVRDRQQSAVYGRRLRGSHAVRRSFDAFGAIVHGSGPPLGALDFHGGLVEPVGALSSYLSDRELVQMGERLYDTRFGRFSGPEPLDPSEAEGFAEDPFTYAHNRPTLLADPSGLWPGHPDTLERVAREEYGWDRSLRLGGEPPAAGEAAPGADPLELPETPEVVEPPGWHRPAPPVGRPGRRARKRAREDYELRLEIFDEPEMDAPATVEPRMPLDTAESLAMDLESAQASPLGLGHDSSSFEQQVHEFQSELSSGLSATGGNVQRALGSVVAGTVTLGSGVVLLASPVGLTIAGGLSAFGMMSVGFASFGLGAARLVSAGTRTEEQDLGLDRAQRAASAFASGPAEIAGGTALVLVGGDLESLESGAVTGGLLHGGFEVLQGVGRASRIRQQFAETGYQGSYDWGDRALKQAHRVAHGEEVVERAARRVHRTLNRRTQIEYREICHGIPRRMIRPADRLRGRMVEVLPALDRVLPSPRAWINHPLNTATEWGSVHALYDAQRWQFASRAFKAANQQRRLAGLQAFWATTPGWTRPVFHGTLRGGHHLVRRGPE